MGTMSKYCKAYLLKDFRQFSDWVENPDEVRQETKIENGIEVEVERVLTDDTILYLHENYAVTDGIFQDENVIFDQVTPDWMTFCQKELGFKIPDYATSESAETT